MHLLEIIDSFGKSPSLIVKTKTEHKTVFGGFVTIVLMVVTVIAAIFFGAEIINKKSPSVNLSTESYPNPEILPYEDNYEFIIGVQNFDKNFEINPGIYIIKGFLFSTVVNSTGVFNSRQDLDIVPCSTETLSRENYNALKQYDLKNFFCISKNQAFLPNEIYINEFFGHDSFRMIQVKIYECKNKTGSETCESKEVIDQFLNLTTITIVSIDNYIQTMDYQKPFTKGIKEGFYYVSQNFFLSLTQYIHHIKVHSDDGLLFSTNKVQGGFKLEEMVDYYIYQRDSDNFVSFSIQLNNVMDGYFRKYYKLQDFAAQIGGIYKTICMVLILVMLLYEETSYYQYLINMFFYNNKNKSYRKTEDSTQERFGVTQGNFNVLNKPSMKNTQTKSSKLISHKKKIIKLSFCDRLFCLSIIPSRCRKKKKQIDALYFKGKQTLNNYLEIGQVVKSIYDINMMKRFILSEDQLNQYESEYLPILSVVDPPSFMKKVNGPLKIKEKPMNNYVKPSYELDKYKTMDATAKDKIKEREDNKSQSKTSSNRIS